MTKEDKNSAQQGATTLGVTLSLLIFIEVTSGFVQGFYTPLLPDLAHRVGVSGEAMNWFQTAQAMSAAVLVPLLSKMGDVLGPRKILKGAVVSVLLGTLLVALAPAYPIVLVGRVLTGPLGVWLPLAVALVYVRVSGHTATRAISILSASLMGGTLLGTFVAGVSEGLADSLLIPLLLPVLLVAASTVIVFFFLPKDVRLDRGGIDWIGFLGFGALILTVILASAFLNPHDRTTSLALFAGVLVVGVIWVIWEKRVDDPAVNLPLTTSRSMAPLYITAISLGLISVDAPSNLVDFLGRNPDVVGYGFAASSTLRAGMITATLIFATIGGFASSFIAAKLGMRITMVGGAITGAVGQALMMVFPHTLAVFWVAGAIMGVGLGVLMGAMPALVAHAAPAGQTSSANGVYSAFLAMGAAVGGAVFKQVLRASGTAYGVPTLSGFETVWAITAGMFLLAAAMMVVVKLKASVADPVDD